jgi:hypothetical protein
MRDGKVGKAQLLDVLHQPYSWWSRWSGTVKEWFSLMWCREEWQLTQTCISTHWKNVEPFPTYLAWQESVQNVASAQWHNASDQHQDSGSHHTTWMVGVTASTLQPRLSTSSDPWKMLSMEGKYQSDDHDVISTIKTWLCQQDKEWYWSGIHALVPHWRTAIELHTEYVEN